MFAYDHQQQQQQHQSPAWFGPTGVQAGGPAPASQPMFIAQMNADGQLQLTPIPQANGTQMPMVVMPGQQQPLFLQPVAQQPQQQQQQSHSNGNAARGGNNNANTNNNGAPGKRRQLVVPPPAPGDTEPGPRQLIVNYIATDMTSEELRALFEPYGPIEVARVVEEPKAGHNRGFGFVYFKHCGDAAAAIDALTGRVLRGKRLRVSYAVPQRPVPRGGWAAHAQQQPPQAQAQTQQHASSAGTSAAQSLSASVDSSPGHALKSVAPAFATAFPSHPTGGLTDDVANVSPRDAAFVFRAQ